jgi:hypothetical protein
MLRMIRTVASSLVVLLVAGTMAPAAAYAAPLGSALHLYVGGAQKDVTFQLNNKGDAAMQVKVGGQLYTLAPHGGMKVTVPVGSDICAASDTANHHAGDVLFTVTKDLKGNILWIG